MLDCRLFRLSLARLVDIVECDNAAVWRVYKVEGMRWFGVILIGLLVVLQYQLWFSHGGIISVWRLNSKIVLQQQRNQHLEKRNAVLVADIHDLKSGNAAIEARAREDLGMIKKGEVFYQVVQ